MKFLSLLASAFLMAPLATATPVPDIAAEPDALTKRNAWSVYLYAEENCDTRYSQGGYSAFGSFGCTTISSDSVDADAQGCFVSLYQDPSCAEVVNVFDPNGDTCFSVTNPIPNFGAIQSFRVDC